MKTDPATLGALEARRLIARKRLSPVELAEACIARVESLDHAVNALIARDFDAILNGARHAEAAVMSGKPLGALHGLPFAVKDMIDVAGLPTTFGSELFADNIATNDSAIVAAMRQAGALPMGKTNTPEWSAGGNTRNRVNGVTANPYDLTRTCAGSSGGSAVALACGYAPLATGSDTGGSLRNPAAYCGIVGFRPSPGVVPGNSRAAGLIPLSTSGPMARTVADAGLMLSVLSYADNTDPFTTVIKGRTPWDASNFSALPRCDLTSLRFAVTEDYGFAPTEPMIRDHFRAILPKLTPFLGQVDQATPDCSNADRIFSVLRGIQFLGKRASLYDNTPEKVGPNVTDNILEGRSYSVEDVAHAFFDQNQYYRNWQTFFESHDFIISPAVTISPRPWRELYPTKIDGKPTKSYYHWLAMAYASTIPGHPSITIPCGMDANGMPFGLQIVGRRHDDLGVLAVANELEAIIAGTDMAVKAPDLDTLRKAKPLSQEKEFLTFN